MSTVALEPLLHNHHRENPKFRSKSKMTKRYYLNYSYKLHSSGGSFCNFRPPTLHAIRACSANAAAVDISESAQVLFNENFPLKRTEKVEGKISIRLDHGKDEKWKLTVGCNLEGKWVLHWGVNYMDDIGSEWDQPPIEMRPPGSVPVKDYAIETPLKKLSSTVEGGTLHEVHIDFYSPSEIAAINFVLKDEETGAWYQHRGRDFMVPLVDCLVEDANAIGGKKGFGIWPGSFKQLSGMFLKPDESNYKDQDLINESRTPNQQNRRLEGFHEEHPIIKEVPYQNSVTAVVRKCPETSKNLLRIETDLPGDAIVHWGVCRNDKNKKWEIPSAPHPPDTKVFKKKKALQTLLKKKENGKAWEEFRIDEEFVGFLFVLKINETTWLNCMGSDFYIPLPKYETRKKSESTVEKEKTTESVQEIPPTEYTKGIINEIRNLVTDISSEKKRKTKSKEAQESILQEIEKLAAEAYSIFRSSIPTFTEESVLESERLKPPGKICSGTGSGFEILCQGFNWESHKSGKWYMELKDKAEELSSLGFTVVWLPPPTESVSPEGYMPKDLYNLNSRYGNIDQLKILVKRFHEVGLRVLGDAVLNHRCAHYQNQNGVWNLFGGRLNWDDRAIVADDPHFQGRGNKSSGDNFHAAPNIDHSQDFVRKDIKEWLCWLRKEIGYDGWRLDFVRGFWGGYVKDYLDASEPYFAVGEYWDSLSYTYGEMDLNQDAHRQRIVDWINATNGAAGAFDVTTKGILHSALERCEYWRLTDQKGKPPGVVGWWPSRAVTFIENHDTGSTQGHWRFPGGKEMQGYAYILTHPGTPAVFYDHIFSHYRSEIVALISLRNRNKIHCRSTVKITKAEKDVYAAIIDDKVAMKIGPGSYEPPTGSQNWSSSLEGKDYKVWEVS